MNLEQELLQFATQAKQLKQASAPDILAHASALLRNPDTTATGCYRAAEVVCGPSFRAWEPESIWLTLERKGIEIPLLNRDKILAATTLMLIPAFWFEVNAFENTTMAFNNILSNGEILQEASPAQLSWAIYEAENLFGQFSDIHETTEFDREPILYTATVLHRGGFILAPTLLEFAQEELDKLNKGGVSLTKSEISSSWKKLKSTNPQKREFTDSALDIQLERLTTVQIYMQSKLDQYKLDITGF